MKRALPDYRGELKPTPWSEIFLTAEIRNQLFFLAHPKCACQGLGYRPTGQNRVHLCHCIYRT